MGDDNQDEAVKDSLYPELEDQDQGGLYKWRNLTLNIVRLMQPASIGRKRTIALTAVRGEFIMHWDDDDIYPHNRVRLQAEPLIKGEADLTVLTQSFLGHLPDLHFFRHPGSSPWLGSLAYSRKTILAMGGFADVSISEDMDFTTRALMSCKRWVRLNVSSIYIRHSGGGNNTWIMNKEQQAWMYGENPQPVEPPNYLTNDLVDGLMLAEADARRRGKCPVVHAFEPDIPKLKSWPNMPDACTGDIDKK